MIQNPFSGFEQTHVLSSCEFSTVIPHADFIELETTRIGTKYRKHTNRPGLLRFGADAEP